MHSLAEEFEIKPEASVLNTGLELQNLFYN